MIAFVCIGTLTLCCVYLMNQLLRKQKEITRLTKTLEEVAELVEEIPRFCPSEDNPQQVFFIKWINKQTGEMIGCVVCAACRKPDLCKAVAPLVTEERVAA